MRTFDPPQDMPLPRFSLTCDRELRPGEQEAYIASVRLPFEKWTPIKNRPGWSDDGFGHMQFDGRPDAMKHEVAALDKMTKLDELHAYGHRDPDVVKMLGTDAQLDLHVNHVTSKLVEVMQKEIQSSMMKAMHTWSFPVEPEQESSKFEDDGWRFSAPLGDTARGKLPHEMLQDIHAQQYTPRDPVILKMPAIYGYPRTLGSLTPQVAQVGRVGEDVHVSFNPFVDREEMMQHVVAHMRASTVSRWRVEGCGRVEREGSTVYLTQHDDRVKKAKTRVLKQDDELVLMLRSSDAGRSSQLGDMLGHLLPQVFHVKAKGAVVHVQFHPSTDFTLVDKRMKERGVPYRIENGKGRTVHRDEDGTYL